MTFDEWWTANVEPLQWQETISFTVVAKPLASHAWSEGFTEGCRVERGRFETTKPAPDKED